MNHAPRIALPLPLLVLVLVLLAGCRANPPRESGARDDTSRAQADRYHLRDDSTPDIDNFDFSKIPEPIPRAEPHSRYGNKSPYTVNGQSYRVLSSAAGYDERGIASYYGTKFHGYKTSNLETYDMYQFSAASKVLPLPSYARVTNLENGNSVIVRVNDRGPFVANRIIDLSLAAAQRLGIVRKGTGVVDVQGIDPARGYAEPGRAAGPRNAGPPRLFVQVGAFAEADNAARLAARLRRLNLGAVRVVKAKLDGRTLRRVQIGPLTDVEVIDRTTARLETLGLPHASVAVE